MKKIHQFIGLCILLVLSSFSEIVRSHKVADQKYLDFGAKFPSVCKVGKPLGDGTLISDQWILTAAHVARAIEKYDGPKKVYFGDRSYPIDEVIVHPDYVPMQRHDIALIRLKQAPKGITPVPLYAGSDEPGKEIVIVGHGYAKAGNSREWESKDGKKRAATNRIERTTTDRIVFNFSHPESEYATRLEGTAGPGDSGGPAFISKNGEYYVAGVSSAGFDGRNGPGTYGAVENYTRVSTHLEWIDSYLEKD